MPNPHSPGKGVRTLLAQALRRDNDVFADGVVPAVHVYGDDLTVMGLFDQVPDVSLVYLVTEAGRLDLPPEICTKTIVRLGTQGRAK